MNEVKEVKCAWNLGNKCEGEVKDALMFKGQIRIPICSLHLHNHKSLLFLQSQGLDIKEVLNQPIDWWEQKAKELEQTTGLKVEDVKP